MSGLVLDPRHHCQLQDAAFTTLTMAEFGLLETQLATLRQVFDEQLALDSWLPGEHAYRHRAYQRFHLDLAELTFTPVEKPPPYVQPRSVNPIAGGIERHFRSMPVDHPVVGIVTHVATVFVLLLLRADVLHSYHEPVLTVDVHYIRITAPGKPTPEGIHRDGLIAGSIHVIQRVNVTGGTTSVFDPSGSLLGRFFLREPFDSLIFDDARVLHYTEDVTALNPDIPGYRDVLLIGVRK